MANLTIIHICLEKVNLVKKYIFFFIVTFILKSVKEKLCLRQYRAEKLTVQLQVCASTGCLEGVLWTTLRPVIHLQYDYTLVSVCVKKQLRCERFLCM